MRKSTRNKRAFGRRYCIRWDEGAGKFCVTLGDDAIGAHIRHEGAVAIATAHAQCTTLPAPQMPYVIETVGGAPNL